MKAEDFLTEKQLNEINLRKAGANTALALAAFNAGVTNPIYNHGDERPKSAKTQKDVVNRRSSGSVQYQKNEINPQETAQQISRRYKIPPELASNIVALAKKHEKPDFPRADDLLSLIGMESSFNPDAVSTSKKDKALGLTQIRPIMWNQDPKKLKSDIEHQIKTSSDILAKYNQKLQNPYDSIMAYHLGLTGFLRGDDNPDYLKRFQYEKQFYK